MNSFCKLAFAIVAAQAASAWAFPQWPPYDPRTHAREYFNTATGNYLVLTDPSEIANGRAGPGWLATGHRFVVPTEGGQPVCRFYAPVPNVHFHTANPAECEALKAPGSGWTFEKIAFNARVPANGTCASGETPVHRLFRSAGGKPLHRYVDASTRATLLRAGWIDEGTAFCTEEIGHDVQRYSRVGMGSAPTTLNAYQCLDYGCILLGNLPAMTREIAPYLPPQYFAANPEYPVDVVGLTGSLLNLFTSVTSRAPEEVMAHSYVGAGGFHLQGADRLGGAYASIRALREAPLDREDMPWQDGVARELLIEASFRLVKVDRGGGHAYGHPTLGFQDRTSGRRIEVTVQAFGTMEPADFVGADDRRVIVSTAFGATPRFGDVLRGTYTRCADGCATELGTYGFRLKRDDFQRVVDLARAVDPRLSPSVADYRVDFFDFKVETFGDARAGVQIGDVQLYLRNN